MIILTIYVFSDSHGSTKEMISLLKDTPPDAVIHLGDVSRDAEDVASIYPQIPFYMVPGNCDGYTNNPSIQELVVDGVKILFSHGHLWSVKQRKDIAIASAKKENADIVLFGHTHIGYCTQEKKLWVMNPGASPDSYGVIYIEQGSAHCELKSSPFKKTLFS